MKRKEVEEKIIELWRQQIGRSGDAPFMIVDCEERKGYKSFYKARISDILILDDDVLSFTLGGDRNKIKTIRIEHVKQIR